ncbi:MAG: Fic family protein [Spirochaetales bacterium]|nr:Fic family protein [Spirochaetales bacterium]
MNKFKPDTPYNKLPLLPPKSERIETIKILKQENRSRSAIAELKGIANIIPNQSILINAIILQEAKDSSEIENIITTQDELYKAISGNQRKYDSATKEVIYYREALCFGFRKIKERNIITVNDIISIQKELLKNDAGIRKTPGTSLINDRSGEVVYTPPQTEEIIRNLLGNLSEYLNDSNDSLTKMAVLHYQFESIHPFYDGNGRTGRIINILYLILKGYLDIPILYLSSYIIKNKSDYYRLLREVTSNENWEEWIIYILRGIEIVAKETIEKVLDIKSLLDSTVDKVKKELPKIYSKELVEELFVHPYCKIEFLTSVLGVERKAASRYLSQLQDIGILKEYKIGREKIFINVELLKVLKDSI